LILGIICREGKNVKTAWTESLSVLTLAALLSLPMAVPVGADSIGTTYDMDRMLSEPHPLADQYGTRWQSPPPSAPVPAPALLPTPSPFPATAPEPPPTTFAPAEPPPISETAPPQPAPPLQPVAKVAPVEATPSPPPLMMAPRLSIDAEGVDLEPEKAQPEEMGKTGEKEFEQPGPPPPLPPG